MAYIVYSADPLDKKSAKDYADRWDQWVYHYGCEGRTGDQKMRDGNEEIRRNRENEKRLDVFAGDGREVPY